MDSVLVEFLAVGTLLVVVFLVGRFSRIQSVHPEILDQALDAVDDAEAAQGEAVDETYAHAKSLIDTAMDAEDPEAALAALLDDRK